MSDDQEKKIDAPGGPIAEQRRHQRMEEELKKFRLSVARKKY